MDKQKRTTPATDRLLRLSHVLAILPVSKSHFWQGVKEGRYPSPVKLSKRVTCWRESDIRALVDSLKGV